MAEEKKEVKKEKNTGMAIVAYFIFFVPLLTDSKDDPFVKYHVKQGLVLLISILILYAVSFVLSFVGIGIILYVLTWIASLVLLVMGIMNAANGEKNHFLLLVSLVKNLIFNKINKL